MGKRRPQGFSPSVKQIIWDRARGCCERCGLHLSVDGWHEYHHRRPRGSGGTSLAWVNLPANGVLLCADCHRWVESNRSDAIGYGWLVSRIGRSVAADVPLFYRGGYYYLLCDFGHKHPITPDGAEECPELRRAA